MLELRLCEQQASVRTGKYLLACMASSHPVPAPTYSFVYEGARSPFVNPQETLNGESVDSNNMSTFVSETSLSQAATLIRQVAPFFSLILGVQSSRFNLEAMSYVL